MDIMIDETSCLSRKKKILTFVTLLALVVTPVDGRTFSFAVMADPHIYGKPDQKARFKTAVDWIIGNKQAEDIELVFIVGDIAWSGNVKLAKEMLDRLDNVGVSYVPIIGDNEVQCGSEREFARIFDSHYKKLSETLPGWKKAPTPVKGKYLQNFSFDYKGCHFICCDFNSRQHGNEGGELHDFAGGSWPWFKDDIRTCSKKKTESIVIFSHIGMFRTGFGTADEFLFSQDEMSKVKDFTTSIRTTPVTSIRTGTHLYGRACLRRSITSG